MDFAMLKNWHVCCNSRKNYQGCILMVDTRVTYIPFMLAFLYNFKRVYLYWFHFNTPLPENIRYDIQ